MQTKLSIAKVDHVAFLSKKWKILEKILDGRKTIESRWYVHKTIPWNAVNPGDTVYFKETGSPVVAKAIVSKTLFFDNLDKEKTRKILDEYGERICLTNPDSPFFQGKNYCILIFFNDVQQIKPFNIDKTGFGNACAWISVRDIKRIKI